MSALDVYNDFLPKLTSTLPVKDPTFSARLVKSGLFSGNIKATVKSKSTDAEAAEYFLDTVIQPPLDDENPDTEALENLLKVMEEFNSKPLKKLAANIREKLGCCGGGGASGGLSPECEAAIQKIKNYYDQLKRMPINDILGSLYSKNVITFDQRKEIETKSPESKRAESLLDLLLNSLMANVIDNYNAFVGVLKDKGEDEDDAVLKKLSQDLD